MAQDFWGWLGSLFGGGRSNKPGGGSKSTGSSKAPSKTSSRPPQSAPTAPLSPFKGGGGGGGGTKAFSAPRPTTPQKDDEPSGPGRAGMSVWDAFIYGQNDSGVERWKADNEERKADGRNGDAWTDMWGGLGKLMTPLPATRERGDDHEPQGLTPGQSNRIFTANDALVEYEKREGLKPGSLRTPGTTPQYTANRALRQYERKEGLREGTVSDVRATRDSIPNPRPKNWSPYGDDDTFYTKELSQEAYAALTPRQRAAIDANTALAQAIMADKAEYDANAKLATSDKDYVSGVKALFGEERGSENYAPRTLAVLQSLQNTGTANVVGKSDFDDYLTGSRLLRESDLGEITDDNYSLYESGERDGLSGRTRVGLRFSQASLETLSSTLSAGQALLDSLRSTEEGNPFGAPTAAIGFNPMSERDNALNYLFDVASQRDSGLSPEQFSEVAGGIEEEFKITPQEIRKYLDTRLTAADYSSAAGQVVSLGSDPSIAYITPDEFRSKYYGGN